MTPELAKKIKATLGDKLTVKELAEVETALKKGKPLTAEDMAMDQARMTAAGLGYDKESYPIEFK